MKGKLKFKIGVFGMLAVMIAIVLSIPFGMKAKNEELPRAYAASTKTTVNDEQFSAMFGGDILFSVERVSTVITKAGNKYTIAKEPEALVKPNYNQFQGSGEGGYYIPAESSLDENSNFYFKNAFGGKAVVDNGEFVMLNNQYNASGALTNNDGDHQDVLMISLGQYVIYEDNQNEKVGTTTNGKIAGITYLNIVTAQHNGKRLPNLTVREVNADGGPFYDFVYLIPQIDGNEGYYQFKFEYMVGGVEYEGEFEFYLLFKTSYTQIVKEEGVSYNAEPTMGWDEGDTFAKTDAPNGFVRYYLGKSGISTEGNVSLPTLTYDYTKYHATIKHTVNRKITTYDYTFNVDQEKDGQYELLCTIINSDGTTTKNYELAYNPSATNNILSILLSEQGNYTFEFQYIYGGYNYRNAPPMNLFPRTPNVNSLAVHGFELQYSKLNHTKAQFAHYSLAGKHSVDLIAPFGVQEGNEDEFKNKVLGFTYALNKGSSLRVGTILKDGTQDTLINNTLKSSANDDWNKLTAKIDGSSLKFDSDTKSLIEGFTYQKTNQGSMLFDQNDAFDQAKSFYLYTPTTHLDGKPDFQLEYKFNDGTADRVAYKKESKWFYLNEQNEELEISADKVADIKTHFANTEVFSNTTSFNKTGYYLVFINILPNGVETINGEDNSFYQIFAFQYSTDSVNINVVEDIEGGDIVGAGRYTKEKVEVSWENPGRFEKALTGYYYKLTNVNGSRDELEKQTANKIDKNTIKLDGVDGSFVKYLIKVQNEGLSASYKIFTIDRTPIMGVAAYVVEKTEVDGQILYQIDANSDGSPKQIYNAITDSLASVNWANKASGANVKATYTVTPFVEDGSVNPILQQYSTQQWITTKYSLGATIGPFDFDKPEKIQDVNYTSVLYMQGIYIFTLTDDAGNSCKFACVIDETDAYFQLTEEGKTPEYYSRDYLLSGKDVAYNAGTHKAINLKIDQTIKVNGEDKYIVSDEHREFLNILASADVYSAATQLKEKGYFWQNGSNYSALFNLFEKNGGNIYATIKHENLAIKVGNASPVSNKPLSGTIRFNKEEQKGATSYYATLYLKGTNNVYSSEYYNIDDAISFMSVEINKDVSRGMAYFSENNFTDRTVLPENGVSSATFKRLRTGSDSDIVNNSNDGILGANATSAKYVGFVWNIGSGDFAVDKVSFVRYQLNPLKTELASENKYFYEDASTSKIVFVDGKIVTGLSYTDGTRAWFSFSNSNSAAQEGLYVVTREYKSGGNYGEDQQIKNYYFIVDRNGIIEISKQIGENIILTLLDAEFNEFSTVGHDERSFGEFKYNVYLKTTKIPAVWQLPVGKYHNSEKANSAGYYAGQLEYELYYIDRNGQAGKTNEVYTILTLDFENEFFTNNDSVYYNTATGLYNVNIWHFLSNHSELADINLRNKLTTQGNADWLFLPGDYVLVIRDKVQDFSGKMHEKIIGFEIEEGTAPTTEISGGFVENALDELNYEAMGNGQYNIVTNSEFIKIKLPKYLNNETTAPQVDQDYLVIKQYYNNKPISYYVNYPYNYVSGHNITVNKINQNGNKIVEIVDNNRYIYLDTMLRNLEYDVTQPLKYEITIRYFSGVNADDRQNVLNAYHYYDNNGKKIYFYETTYTIEIDRVAPTTNVDNLVKSDNLINHYVAEYETPTMFAHGVHDSPSEVLFTYEYDKYYNIKETAGKPEPSKIYALRVDGTETYSFDDVAVVKTRSISDFSRVNFPITEDFNNTFTKEIGIEKFAGLFDAYGYYEVIELDKAGNITQYVVLYTTGEDLLSIPIKVQEVNGEWKEGVSISSAEAESFTIFDIDTLDSGNITKGRDDFYHIELRNLNGNVLVGEINTNNPLMKKDYTDSDSLVSQLVAMIKKSGKGNYALTIKSRTHETTTIINLYDSQDRPKLDIKQLVVEENGNYFIKLEGANITKDGIVYYAKEISVIVNGETVTYDCLPEKGYHYYKRDMLGNHSEISTYSISCSKNTTYQIKMKDVFDEQDSYRFNTSGYLFYDVTFAGPDNSNNNGKYEKVGNIYYGFTNARIMFDKSLGQTAKLTYKINTNTSGSLNLRVGEPETVMYNTTAILKTSYSGNYGYIDIIAIEKDIAIGLVDVEAEFKICGVLEGTYHLVIDNRVGNVSLRDFTTGENRDTYKAMYKPDPTKEIAKKSNSGIMNLSWQNIENEYFDYQYILHEHMKDGTISVKELTTTNCVISTDKESEGLYHFEIRVYSKKGEFLGNAVYTFDVQAINNQLFYVKNEQNKAINSNSTFNFDELGLGLTPQELQSNYPSGEIPLYISNGELEVVLVEGESITMDSYELPDQTNYKFTVVKLKVQTNDIWFGLLQMNSKISVVKNLTVKKLVTLVDEITGEKTQNEFYQNIDQEKDYRKTIYGGIKDQVSLLATSTNINREDVLIRKNSLILDVYYNDKLLESRSYKIKTEDDNNELNYEIKGNGKYKFIIRDLAGNEHQFSLSNGIEVNVMREVVVTVNDEAPIENAFYNGAVSVKIFNRNQYKTGSISLNVKRNGVDYANYHGDNPYVFTEYGTYRLTFRAVYIDKSVNPAEEREISKTLVFTIINAKEARQSIDFTAFASYEIKEVLNSLGEDVTKYFKQEVLNKNNGSMLLTYEDLMEGDNPTGLNLTTGKVNFTITYVIKDAIYPEREVQFSFCMNNETPTIECSLGIGETSNEGFNISFNAGIIYEQIGEAYVYINNEAVAFINENSSFDITTISKTFKDHGAGDYYVRLVSSSGNVLSSYKVVIKEPLNASAIIIIVVVAAVVATVVITIIVLRRKMRIR